MPVRVERPLTRGERVVAFIERYCRVPEGKLVGQPIRLEPFQRRFILDVYDNPHGTRRAYLSIGRKNGKSALISCILLAHICGPEAVLNSQICAGAMSEKQAKVIFRQAQKMIRLNPILAGLTRIVPSEGKIFGLKRNVEFMTLAANGPAAHGLSPILALVDEVGQVKGPYSDFIEAIETAQGAYDNPLFIAISTQAANDADLFSIWLDDAEQHRPPDIVSHVYSAPADADLMDEDGWAAANPALGVFRSRDDVEKKAIQAVRMPSEEASFRWLFLNQRVVREALLVSIGSWRKCAGNVADDWNGSRAYAGLDLSRVNDLTAFVVVAKVDGVYQVRPTFWLPEDGLRDRAKKDRVPYDVWARNGYLQLCPGRTIDYGFVAAEVHRQCRDYGIRRIAFDRWGIGHMKPKLIEAGFTDEEVDGDKAVFRPHGQGFKDMAPALNALEAEVMNERMAHGGHPVLTMCATNAVVTPDPAGNRKLDKAKSTARIDGMVALAMAVGTAESDATEDDKPSVYEDRGILLF